MESPLKLLKGKDVEQLNIETWSPIRATPPPDEIGKPQTVPTTNVEKNEDHK
jgi:hypothetical protein